MPVEAKLEVPVGQAGEVVVLPMAEDAVAGGVQVVVVALEVELARVGGDVDIVPALGPEDVVLQLDAARGAVDEERIAGELVNRVVGEKDAVGALDAHAERGVGVDQVVGEERTAENVVDAGALDSNRVVVDLVAHDDAGAAGDDARCRCCRRRGWT